MRKLIAVTAILLGLGTSITAATPPTATAVLVPDRQVAGRDGSTWTSVAGGGQSTCAIKSSGTLWCWGRRQGSDGLRYRPTQVGEAGDWTAVTAGRAHFCGIRAPGTLWCWGWNEHGQLGDATTVSKWEGPIRIGTDSDWTEVVASRSHTCGIRGGGSLWCWGLNSNGELGDGTQTQHAVPTAVDGDGWRSVTVGLRHTCALRGGGLYCWGNNADGQLGDGTRDQRLLPVPVGAADNWSRVSAGGRDCFFAFCEDQGSHTCAVRQTGTLWCWGAGDVGQIGTGTTQDELTPTRLAGRDWRTVQTGGAHTCATRADRSSWCWGDNVHGQLGSGRGRKVWMPREVLGGRSWRLVAADAGHDAEHATTCGITLAGSLWCWGSNDLAQLGLGYAADHLPSARRVSDLGPVRSVSAGEQTTCAVGRDRRLWCWGDNFYGEVGDGTRRNSRGVTQVGAADDWSAVSAANDSTCGIRAGALFCWGREWGLRPVRVGDARDWRTIEADCGTRTNGSLWCLDSAGSGRPRLVRVGRGSDWTVVTRGSFGLCALRTNATLWCGAYGDNPVRVGRARDWVALNSTWSRICGLRGPGTLWCWGGTSGGSPSRVGDRADWTEVAVGLDHQCGVRGRGALFCWGHNRYGQLGLGTRAAPDKPTRLGDATDWWHVSANFYSSCAIKRDGSLWCWGLNGSGQSGRTPRTWAPLRVRH